MKIVSKEQYDFTFRDPSVTWTFYSKEDAEWMNQQLKDAKRYQWLREHPAWETEAFLGGLSPQQFDAAVDSARGYLA